MFAAADKPGNAGNNGNNGNNAAQGQQGNPNPGAQGNGAQGQQGQQGNPGNSEHGGPQGNPGNSEHAGPQGNPGNAQGAQNGNANGHDKGNAGHGATPPGHEGEKPGNGPKHDGEKPGNGPKHDGEKPGNGPKHDGEKPGNGPKPDKPGNGPKPDKPGNGPKPDKPGKGEKGDKGESSSTTTIVERVVAGSETSKDAPGLTAKPVVAKRRCASRRVVTMRLDRYYRVRSARVLVNGRRAKVTRTRRGMIAKVDLRGKKQGVYTVRTVVLTKGGKLKMSTRKFATCGASVKKRG